MILEGLLSLFLALLTGLFSLLPVPTVPPTLFSDALTAIEPWQSSVGFFLPLTVTLTCLSIVLGIYTLVFAVHGLNFILRRIPTQS